MEARLILDTTLSEANSLLENTGNQQAVSLFACLRLAASVLCLISGSATAALSADPAFPERGASLKELKGQKPIPAEAFVASAAEDDWTIKRSSNKSSFSSYCIELRGIPVLCRSSGFAHLFVSKDGRRAVAHQIGAITSPRHRGNLVFFDSGGKIVKEVHPKEGLFLIAASASKSDKIAAMGAKDKGLEISLYDFDGQAGISKFIQNETARGIHEGKLVVSPNGKYVFAGTDGDLSKGRTGRVFILNDSGEVIKSIPGYSPRVLLAPTAGKVAIWDRSNVEVLNIPTLNHVWKMKFDSTGGSIGGVEGFSPDGSRLLISEVRSEFDGKRSRSKCHSLKVIDFSKRQVLKLKTSHEVFGTNNYSIENTGIIIRRSRDKKIEYALE